ncbi:MAG: DUF4013 domain-containing protein [Methanomicrobium sp.]|nr:DUF4013 domain-containing protein [Methanomicrobium sp.]
MNIGSNLSSSFGYAKDGLVGHWVRWILLLISCIIFPLILGYQLRIMRGEDPAPEADNWLKMLVDGILYIIIGIIYAIPMIIIAMITMGPGVFMLMSDPSAVAAGMGTLAVGIIILIIVAIIISLFETIAIVNFARKESFGAAFAFGDILAKIKEIGWFSLFIQILVYGIIIAIIQTVLGLIPILGMIILLILSPLFAMWYAKYVCNIYDNAQ